MAQHCGGGIVWIFAVSSMNAVQEVKSCQQQGARKATEVEVAVTDAMADSSYVPKGC
jgi:hypothetical protein